jgi:hypothetical protein
MHRRSIEIIDVAIDILEQIRPITDVLFFNLSENRNWVAHVVAKKTRQKLAGFRGNVSGRPARC